MNKIIKKQMLVGGTILMLAATSALGMENGSNNAGDFYRANELSFDVFGTGSVGKYTIDHISNSRVRHNGKLGAGLGLNYFFCRHLGIGADVYSENTSGVFIDSTSANLILRLPLGQSRFAPYAFGGGGHQFDLAKVSFLQAGAGIECRFTPMVGMFADARMVWPDETKYYGVARVGVRFSF